MDSTIIAEDNNSHIEHNNNNTAAVSPNPLKCPPTPQYQLPPAALNQLSPERLNQPRIPQSPSLHSYLVENDRPRTRDSITSDVQAKIALLNSLAGNTTSVQTSPTRRGRGTGRVMPTNGNAGVGGAVASLMHGNVDTNGVDTNIALQQAVMGYEEAQASLATITAELERAKEELASRKKRERLLAQRVESLLEELQAEKEKRARDQESYTKEVKRCRKEAYRAELAAVESRQDLQEVRAELKRCQAEVQHEKAEKEKSRQESFERAYALAGTVGEMEQLKDKLRVVEKERDAALLEVKANQVGESSRPPNRRMKEEDITQPQQLSQDTEDGSLSEMGDSAQTNFEVSSVPTGPAYPAFESLKFRLELYEKKMQGEPVTPAEEIRFLKQELKFARKQHAEDRETIHFMHMQCQFKACPCRLAEEKGERFIHDHAYEAMLEQERTSKKRKVSHESSEMNPPAQEDKTEEVAQSTGHQHGAPEATQNAHTLKTCHTNLPPDPTPDALSAAPELPSPLQEAIEVPLPEPQPMELDARDETPEPTAQLEEITQVIVEPGTASKPFCFSTSTTSNPANREQAPPLRHTESASAVMEQDLFDLSPPKQAPHPPRRPSTAMGILTVDSPIRLVPDSPRSVRASHSRRENHWSNTTGTFVGGYQNQNQTQSFMTMTTKVALKDCPSRTPLHRRAQSRPNVLPTQSPLASSVVSHLGDDDDDDDDDQQADFIKETSASPAPHTVFPVTPVHKHSRSMHDLAQHHHHPQTGSRAESAEGRLDHARHAMPTTETTTTTRVPLRGFEDTDEMAGSDERQCHTERRSNRHSNNRHAYGHGYEHAHTEVLNVNLNVHMDAAARVRDGAADQLLVASLPLQPVSVSGPISSSSSNSNSILGNIPGTPISREAALAQIRARRDRARSINLKKSTENNLNSNAGNLNKGMTGSTTTKLSPTKPKVVVNGGVAGLFAARDKENAYGRREISQASAPGRFVC
ncbi:hypothetical protein ABEF95_000841 [Exophiala dermatitidis]